MTQPVDVKVVNPVTVTGKIDIGNKVEVSGSVETLNDALKIPFHRTVRLVNAQVGLVPLSKDVYTVPAGMRLTIESVSARILVPTGQKVYTALGFFGENASDCENYLALQPQGVFGSFDVFVSSQNLKIILDSTSRFVTYEIHRNSDVGDITFSLTINGYLEEVP